MKQHVKRIIILIMGSVFIVLGVAGLFLPGLQGILFLLIGLVLLSKECSWAKRLLHRLRHRFPKLDHKLEEIKVKEKELLKRFKYWFGQKKVPK